MRTFPRGVLKKGGGSGVVPVKDPAKSPPARKDIRKHTVRMLTDKGADARRKTIRQRVRAMKDDEVRSALQKAGVSHNPRTPAPVLREMLEGGVEAGMISSI